MNKNKKKKRRASQLSTLCKLLKIAIGVGVLALPNGFKRVNLLGGYLVLLLSGLLQYYSWDLLVQVIENTSKLDSDHESSIPSQEQSQQDDQTNQREDNQSIQFNNDTNIIDDVDISQTESNYNPLTNKQGELKYKDVNLISAFKIIVPENKKMIIMVQIVTFLLFFGNAVGLIMFFNQTLHAFGNEISPQSKYQFPISIGTIIMIMMFSLLKRIEDLRKLTRTGSYLLFVAIYFFISISLLQIQQNYQNNVLSSIEYGINYRQIPYFFGVAIFSYDVNGMFTEIREEMKNPQYFRRNMKIQMTICFFVYSTFGGLCYLAYGQLTDSLITMNLDKTISSMGFVAKYAFLILQLFYALSMILNVILENIVSIKLIEAIPHILFNFKQQLFPLYVKLLIRFIYVTVCVVSAVYIQSFSNIITFLGSTTSVILGFVVPNYLYGKLFPQKQFTVKIFNYFVVILGIIGGILGASQCFQ